MPGPLTGGASTTVTGIVHDTVGAPDNGVGLNADFAFDDATKTIYGPKAAGVWPAGVVLGAPAAAYLVYTALLTQAATDAPAALVLQNTLGGVVEWSYNSVGDYVATLTAVFTSNKTSTNVSGIRGSAQFAPIDNNTISLKTRDFSDSLGDQLLSLTFVEIRVYP